MMIKMIMMVVMMMMKKLKTTRPKHYQHTDPATASDSDDRPRAACLSVMDRGGW